MKILAKAIVVAAACAAICFTDKSPAQQSIATWFDGPLVNGGGASPAPFTNNTSNANVIVYPITKGAGIGSVTTGDAYGGNNWTNAVLGTPDTEANSIASSNYVTWAVQATPGYTLSFSTNFIFLHASSTGPHTNVMEYSTDGVNFKDIASLIIASGTTSTVWTNILSTNSFLQSVPAGVTNYFRIVAWGATGTAGTWYIYDPLPAALASATNVLGTNDFVIDGAATPIPPATSLATWFDGPLVNGGGASPAPFTNNTANANVIVYPITKGAGVGSVTTGDAYGGNNWTNAVLGTPDTEANSIASSNYVTWAVEAATNYSVSFFTNFIFLHVSSTGPHTNVMEYSTDGVNFTDIASFTVASGTTSTVWTNILSTNQFLQNVPSTVTNYFRIVAWGATGTAGTWYIYDPLPAALASATNVLGTNDFVIDGGVISLLGIIAPTNILINPVSQNVNAGQSPSFTVSQTGSSASYSWYFVANSTTNLIIDATNATLSISDALGANAGVYFAVLSNAAGVVSSPLATLTVNDPIIEIQPANSFGLLDGQVQFTVTVAGTTPVDYQWYFATPAGVPLTPLTDGNDFSDASGVYGSQTAVLTITNLQQADLANFVVKISNSYGSQTSSVASILGINVVGSPLAFWDFSGSNFIDITTNPTCLVNPIPWLGVGTAQAVGTVNDPGTSPFIATTSADPSGGEGVTFFGLPAPQIGFSWGIGLGALPVSTNSASDIDNSNKMSGIQFNVSTVGAKNIKLSYDARATQTASEFERVQYTTNGTSWIDYPAATSFNGIAGSVASGWETYPQEDYADSVPYDNYPSYLSSYFDFTGFPGAANNPAFGVRIVLEYQNTATYGIQATNTYAPVGENYGSGGTLTYDLVGLYGDSITNNNVPPVISALTNAVTLQIVTNIMTLDNSPVTNTFTVSGDTTANRFTYSALSLNPATVNPTFAFTSNALGNCTIVVNPNPISANLAAAPILVTVTDTNGDSASTWFLLTLATLYPSPSVGDLFATNTLANTPLNVPFLVSSPTDSVSQFTYSADSGNNTVVPSQNVVVNPNTGVNPTNPIITITPGNNQLGVSVINVTVDDNNVHEPKTTTVTIPFMVRPNTNIVAIDYFNYDNSGGLDAVSGGFWQHLSGFNHQMQVYANGQGDYVDVDTFNNTENLQTPLLGAPYSTNAASKVTTLYYSFVLNLNPNIMPQANGSYISAFNDGSGVTADVEDLLVLATNGVVTPGDFRIGIADDNGATGANANTAMLNQDLVPGINYVVVTSLNLSNGVSTLWVNPENQSSASTVAPQDTGTILYNISNFELRESGQNAGAVNVSGLKVGTTFDSVFPSLHVNVAGTNAIVNWSDPTLGIQGSTNVQGPYIDISPASPPYTNNISTNSTMFYRFGR